MTPSNNGRANRKPFIRNHWFLMAVLVGGLLLLVVLYRVPILQLMNALYSFVIDRDRVSDFITSSGVYAPLVFIALQVLQVVFAPFPGEASGFIGGYIFGVGRAFLFSTIGLSVGSLINLMIGRYFGQRFIRTHVPDRYLKRFDTFLKRQGVLVILVLFVFPGFPKDYLCLFLGLSRLPIKLLFLLASVGRIPGTLMLSLQGAFLYEKNYGLLAVMAVASLIIVFLAYWYREHLYNWVERLNQD